MTKHTESITALRTVTKNGLRITVSSSNAPSQAALANFSAKLHTTYQGYIEKQDTVRYDVTNQQGRLAI